MNCLNCYTINDDGIKNCKKCGMEMLPYKGAVTENNNSDKLLFTFIAIAFISALLQFFIEKFFSSNWYNGSTKYLIGILWVVRSLSFILVALSIKDKYLKTTAIIFSVILMIYWLFYNIEFLLRG